MDTVQCTDPGHKEGGLKKNKRKRDEQPGQSFEKFEQKAIEQRNNKVILLAREGEIGKASMMLKDPCHVITEQLCQTIDKT